jgi:hypothetical protein
MRKYIQIDKPGNCFIAIQKGCILFLLFALLSLTGCQISTRVRTLPEEIESVYVPMFLNITSKPGLEELATRASIEAFLADGRLDVVSPQLADVVVQGIIQDFTDEISSAESDDFPMMNTMNARVTVKLYSPDDRLNPLHSFKTFVVSRSYVSDLRRSTLVIPDDALDGFMDAIGERVVLEVLTGGFREIGSR